MSKRWMIRLTPMAILATAALSLVGCAGSQPAEEPAAEPAAPAAEAAAGLDPAILADSRRPADEVAEDAARKPLELYAFFGVQPGMTVADLWPGAGYNTHLLSNAVGPDGTVYCALGFYGEFQEGAIAQQVRDRVASMPLANVQIVDEISGIPAGSLDAAITVRNYHDLYGFGGDAPQAVRDIFAALKPGGIVGIVEVATDREGWDEETHRLNEQVVIDDFTAAGFELVERSDMLANPADDHSGNGFAEGRHTMDRYVLKLRKPESAAPAQ